ncbi:hypothetical protein, partial [Janthinobacterium sp.]|uniref:hypothetical protein n=1 Tax=Janthinobacterium sp. TaxID=1871054 RepID=UPI00261A7F03
VEMAYDANGNQILQRDALGNTITRTYDAERNLLLTETTYQIADPDGAGPGQPGKPQTTRYVYDVAGHLRFQISPQGRVTENLYDSSGARVTSAQYTGDNYDVSGMAPDALPNEATMTAWEARRQDRSTAMRTDYDYDVRGLLARTRSYATVLATGAGTPPKSHVMRYVYDQGGRLLQQIDKSNNVTSFAYDGLGRLLTTTDPLGNVILHRYDDAGGRMSVQLANGLTTTSVYNKAGELTDVIQTGLAGEELGRTSYAYDADGRLRMTTGPTGARSYMLYDQAGRKAADITADGVLTQYEYDTGNQLTHTVRYAQVVNSATLARLVAADGSPLAVTLAQAGVLPPASAQDQNEWRLYDAASRLLKTVSAAGAVTDYSYDGASQLVQTISRAKPIDLAVFAANPTLRNAEVAADVRDHSVWREYDQDGLLRFEVDADRYMSEYGYDSAGRLVHSVKYAVQLSTLELGVALSSMIPEATAQDSRTFFRYDGRGNILWIDSHDESVVNSYDPLGRLSETTRSSNTRTQPGWLQQERFYYDAAGRVQSITRRLDGAADETQYTFDLAGNKVRESNANGTLYYRYDLQGRLIGALSAQGGVMLTALGTDSPVSQIELVWRAYGIRYEYDKAGTLIREIRPMTDDGNPVDGGRIIHDEFGREIALADAHGNVTLVSYNAIGGKTTWKQIDGKILVAEYDARGLLIAETLPETGQDASGARRPVVIRYSYDASGKLIQKIHAAGLVMQEITDYAYDQAGEVHQRTVVSNGIRTVFDELDRITSLTEAQGKVTLTTYHVDGSKTVSISLNGVTTIAEYDAFGRRVVSTKGPSGEANVTTYEPDGSYTSTVKTVEGLVTVSEYDAQGRLTSETRPETGLDASGKLLPVINRYSYNLAGQVTRQVRSLGLVAEQIIEFEYDQTGQMVQQANTNGGVRVVYDGLGKFMHSTDQFGNVTRASYDENGLKTIASMVNGLTTITEYDARDREVRTTWPTSGLDAAGVMRPRVDRYFYDEAGRTVKIISSEGLVAQGSIDYEYDQAGRLVQTVEVNDRGVRFVIDTQGRVVSTVTPSGEASNTTYESDGSYTTVNKTTDGRITTLQYDARNKLIA